MTTATLEKRRLDLADADAEVRVEDDNAGPPRFTGYAARFNSRTSIGDPLRWGFYEEIAPGAFSDTITVEDQRFLIDHDPYYVVSRRSAGTLALAEDPAGLGVDSALDEALSYVRDLRANLANRNITGMSFGFRVVDDAWNTETVETKDGHQAEVEVRTLRKVQLIEVSAVTFPAYTDTTAAMRSVSAALLARNDHAAIEARAAVEPGFADLLNLVDKPAPTGPPSDVVDMDLRMRMLAARFPALTR